MKRAALFILALCSWGAGPVQATTISAPFLTVAVGETFAVEISITDAVELASVPFDLAFTPAIVQANPAGATAGADLPAEWFFTGPGALDNTNGHVVGVSAFGSRFSGTA